MKNWFGISVLVLGAARQGTAVARFLSANGAKVILNDHRPQKNFIDLQEELNEGAIKWHFGGHPIRLLKNVEMLCISGGVPLDLPIIKEASKRSIPLTNDSQIFLENVTAPVIGITGSAGKTTTTVFVGEIAKAAVKNDQKVWVGGNIGLPLIISLKDIKKNDLVILEFSSFQLELMTISPHIGAILNITPNHLDRHGTIHAYTTAKAHILDYQQKDDIAVLNCEDHGSWNLFKSIQGKLITFGKEKRDRNYPGTNLVDGYLQLYDGNVEKQIMSNKDIKLRGEHNLMNALAACSIAFAAGFPIPSMQKGIAAVKGIPHRLEFVRNWREISWYDDSIATTPERTIAAIRSFNQPLILLLGGRDKKLPWNRLATEVHNRVKHIVVFGEAAELISTTLTDHEEGNPPYNLKKYENLEKAIYAAAEIAVPGDTVLLAPGGTSFDEFRDFEERGDIFKRIVNNLT
ncbi:MAG TPA: UDP-N-acetylmuramoyl-L-alanine--D-glutamate ligase [Anaerolineae bacterium]|nr:UDP-N-acetylmuramoyl-L-alanine--D-glutamate ligase [Anaerolineae bacterium]